MNIWNTESVFHKCGISLRYLQRDSKNPLLDALLTLELYRRSLRRYDLIFILHFTNKPNIYGAFAAKLCRVNSIAVVTGLGYAFIHNGLVQQITTFLYKISARFHRKVVFENLEDRDLFVKTGIIDPTKALALKGCGVDVEFFRPISKQRWIKK